MPKKSTERKYDVSFTITVAGDDDVDEETVEEALSSLVDGEIRRHDNGEKRCALKFVDAVTFSAMEAE